MFEYETYSEKKWLERHGIGKDSVYLRETHSRVEDKQRWKHRSGEGIMNHLYDLDMSWFQHAKVAWKLSLRLFLLMLAAFFHGLFPFMLTHTTSNGIKKLNEEI